jgi:hypothetical protein
LLAAGDVGLVPWVPLAQFDGPPEPVFRQCRARIEQDAPADEQENLLAVTQLLAGLRYNDPSLFQLFDGECARMCGLGKASSWGGEKLRLTVQEGGWATGVLVARCQTTSPATDLFPPFRKGGSGGCGKRLVRAGVEGGNGSPILIDGGPCARSRKWLPIPPLAPPCEAGERKRARCEGWEYAATTAETSALTPMAPACKGGERTRMRRCRRGGLVLTQPRDPGVANAARPEPRPAGITKGRLGRALNVQ